MIRGAVLTTLLTLLPLAANAQYEATPTATATPISESGVATPAPTAAPALVTTGATKLKIGGVFYAFYKYDLSKNAHDINNFDVSRAYVNVEPSWGDDFSARVTTD